MKKCFSTCLFQAKRYKKSYLNLPKTMSLLKDDFDLVIYHDSSLTKEMKSNFSSTVMEVDLAVGLESVNKSI